MSLARSLIAIALLLAAPLAAQMQRSEGYTFLQNVREAKTQQVMTALNKPGSLIINTRDITSGETALHIVVRRGDGPYATFLMQRGADVNARDGRNNTPLMVAVDSGNGDMVPLLLAGRANPNLANASGETPLIRAVQRRDLALVRTLIAGKADPDQRDNIAGMSARDYADRDTRATAIAKLFAETPRRVRAPVAGPTL